MKNRYWTILVSFAVACACLIDTSAALVIGTADATATLKITGYNINGTALNAPPAWLTVLRTHQEPPFIPAFGNKFGNANFDGFSTVLKTGDGPQIGDSLTLRSRSMANAAAPEGMADAFTAAWGQYDFTNNSPTTNITISYSVDWSWESTTTGTDLVHEEGSASPEVRFATFVKGTRTNYPTGNALSDQGTFPGVMFLMHGQQGSVHFSTGATSSGVAHTPEPSSAMVLIVGELITLRRWRKTAATTA